MLLTQGYQCHKLRKAFSKFYRRHSELIVKYNVGLKTLLHQGISKPVFCGDLVYKINRIVGKLFFMISLKRLSSYIKEWYIACHMDIMQHSTITVYSYGFLFNCTMEGLASDSMTTLTLIGRSVTGVCLWLGPPWLNWGFSSQYVD